MSTKYKRRARAQEELGRDSSGITRGCRPVVQDERRGHFHVATAAASLGDVDMKRSTRSASPAFVATAAASLGDADIRQMVAML